MSCLSDLRKLFHFFQKKTDLINDRCSDLLCFQSFLNLRTSSAFSGLLFCNVFHSTFTNVFYILFTFFHVFKVCHAVFTSMVNTDRWVVASAATTELLGLLLLLLLLLLMLLMLRQCLVTAATIAHCVCAQLLRRMFTARAPSLPATSVWRHSTDAVVWRHVTSSRPHRQTYRERERGRKREIIANNMLLFGITLMSALAVQYTGAPFYYFPIHCSNRLLITCIRRSSLQDTGLSIDVSYIDVRKLQRTVLHCVYKTRHPLLTIISSKCNRI